MIILLISTQQNAEIIYKLYNTQNERIKFAVALRFVLSVVTENMGIIYLDISKQALYQFYYLNSFELSFHQ